MRAVIEMTLSNGFTHGKWTNWVCACISIRSHCTPTTNLHTSFCSLWTAMVHVQDDVSSALKSVTVHGPVINTWQPYGFCIFGFRQCISFICVHKEISEYKTATVRVYHLNVTARAGRMPLNKVFKQFSLIFAIKQSNNKLINVVFITSCLFLFHLQIFKLQVFLCIIYLSSGNRNLMNSSHIYLQHGALLYFFKWQWRLFMQLQQWSFVILIWNISTSFTTEYGCNNWHNEVKHSLLPVYLTDSGCMTLHGTDGLSSQMRSIRFVVTGTRKRPPASRSVCRGFQMLYLTRFGSAPTREPGRKVLVNHFACDGVLGSPVIRTEEAHNFTWRTCFLFININTYTIKW